MVFGIKRDKAALAKFFRKGGGFLYNEGGRYEMR
jgi:hypothetical protein